MQGRSGAWWVGLALVVMLVAVGTGGAIADHPLTGRDVKNNSLTGRDVHGLKARDFTKQVRRQFEATGPQGLQGPPGVQGLPGVKGPS